MRILAKYHFFLFMRIQIVDAVPHFFFQEFILQCDQNSDRNSAQIISRILGVIADFRLSNLNQE